MLQIVTKDIKTTYGLNCFHFNRLLQTQLSIFYMLDSSNINKTIT